MVYHGPVTKAQSYLANLPKPYLLPPAESLADWLIDVSSGRLTPSQYSLTVKSKHSAKKSKKHKKKKSKRKDKEREEVEGDDAVSTRGPSTAQFEHSMEIAKERRQDLYDSWKEHYDSLSGKAKERYIPPKCYDLPARVEKPSFWTQLRGQVHRNLLMIWRNRASKLVDTLMIVGAVVLISWLQGVTKVTLPKQPGLSFNELVEGDPHEIPKTFPNLFGYALLPTSQAIEFALKIGVITAVLLGLTAAKSLTSKRLEFFRESGSGWGELEN